MAELEQKECLIKDQWARIAKLEKQLADRDDRYLSIIKAVRADDVVGFLGELEEDRDYLLARNARLSLRCERLQKNLKAAINRNVALKEANAFFEDENGKLRMENIELKTRPPMVLRTKE